METETQYSIQSIWNLPVLACPERWAEIRFLQEQVIHRPVPDELDGFRRMLANADHVIFQALCDGERIVGMVQGTRIDNIIHSKVFVDSVAIHPELQGRGLGQFLFRAFEHEVCWQWPEVQQIILTSAEKRGTRNFYTGLGYEPREGDSATLVYRKYLE